MENPDRDIGGRLYWAAGFTTVALIHGLWEYWNQTPPVWDMAYHQLQGWACLQAWREGDFFGRFAEFSTYYPPLYYLQEALVLKLFSATQWLALLSNLPGLALLGYSTFRIAEKLMDSRAAAVAGVMVLLLPMVAWTSRASLLEITLSGWVAAGGFCLLRSRALTSRGWTLLFALICVAGQLTKWTFGLFQLLPLFYLLVISSDRKTSLRNLADALLIAIPPVFAWYLPNLKTLTERFYLTTQAGIGLEQDPQLDSLLGWIYYPRALSSYYLFLPLTLLLLYSLMWSIQRLWRWNAFSSSGRVVQEVLPGAFSRLPESHPLRSNRTDRHLQSDGSAMVASLAFLWLWMAGGVLLLTLLGAKDPRYVLPLAGPLAVLLILPFADRKWWPATILALAVVQFVAVSFRLPLLPQKIAFFSIEPERDYQSVRQEWVLFETSYFGISGPPRQEDWKLAEILGTIGDSGMVGFVPDSAFFHPAVLELKAVEKGADLRAKRLGQFPFQPQQLDGLDWVVGKTGEQGISYITLYNHQVYEELERQDWQLVQSLELPDQSHALIWRRPTPSPL